MMVCIGFLVYGVLALYMPQTYSNNLNAALDEYTKNFIADLTDTRIEDSNGLFDQFLKNTSISKVELYTNTGVLIDTPSNNKNEIGIVGEAISGTSYEQIPIISNTYRCTFAGNNNQYILIVYGEASQIMVLKQTILHILPLLLSIIILVSLIISWVYSHIITQPVIKICQLPKEMSNLQFTWQLDECRTDELGVLQKSLNALSQKLYITLTDLQNVNQQLQKDIAYEKELEQTQKNFFSAASHELKTPITIIKGQLEGMLFDVGSYKDHKKYLARSLEVINMLELMVQEILTITKLQACFNLKKECFDCIPMIHNYLNTIDDLIVKKDLNIQFISHNSILIEGNKMLLEKVFSNLIINAVKYSPAKASIYIIAQKENNTFSFCIENTGTHIPETDIPKLFDAFYRVEQSRSRKTGGSGLGLFIVNKILQQHNSYCEACNTEKGVKFFFSMNEC